MIVIPRYRSSDIAVFPGQIRDIRTAVSFFSARAKEFCADPARIFLWGDSSGAHTVLMTAFTCTDPAFGPVCPPFQGVVDYYGPVNLIEMGHSPSVFRSIQNFLKRQIRPAISIQALKFRQS